MVEMKFTVPLGRHLFKGFIDYKTGGEPGPDERSRQLLLYAHGLKHRYPEYTVRRLRGNAGTAGTGCTVSDGDGVFQMFKTGIFDMILKLATNTR